MQRVSNITFGFFKINKALLEKLRANSGVVFSGLELLHSTCSRSRVDQPSVAPSAVRTREPYPRVPESWAASPAPSLLAALLAYPLAAA